MKRLFAAMVSFMLASGALCAAAAESAPLTEGAAKTLVVYFSCTGTTRALASYAAEILGADLMEIAPETPYTEADLRYYTDCRADREQRDSSARPAISNDLSGISDYDFIVLGYPIWHGLAPRAVYTFVESCDLSQKTILPFCTSGSSPIGSSADELRELCSPDTNWLEGKRFGASATMDDMRKWLESV